jgi:WD40 repeat protein
VAERNALQEHVFPRLRELCQQHGCRFQAIDLRWGVSEEAGLDQQTMKICLGEIARCQKVSPRPNFIVLLGNRFGWRPLPDAIPAEEFERLLPLISDEEQDKLLWRTEQPEEGKGWYRRDDNAVPAEYVLQPRQRGSSYKDYGFWESKVERPLVAVLERAALAAGLDEDALAKYTLSATGQEIVRGAMQVEDASAHVFGFFRSIRNRQEALDATAGKSVIESDPNLQQRQQDLKDRLKQRLDGNIYEYEAQWQTGGVTTAHIGSLPPTVSDCLKLNDSARAPANLCEAVWLRLSQVILAETGRLETADPLQGEQDAHHEFGRERARLFVGREDLLARIAEYLAGSDNHPLAVVGASGSGKSALMARAVQQAESGRSAQATLIARFIGATPESSNGRALLESLCRQITRAYGGDESTIPSEYRDLVLEFPKRLALALPARPLLLFLDALDQLSEGDGARSLAWLPADLPPHVKLVASTLPGECLAALERRLPASSKVSVPALSKMSGERLLQGWLAEARRTLADEQQADILTKFERGGGLPLYLKLAFEEARHWYGYGGLPARAGQPAGLSEDIPGIIHDFFARLEQENNHGRVLVSHALGYLAAARNGLSEDELLQVLWEDGEAKSAFFKRSPKSPQVITALPVVIWARLFLDLAPYLAFRRADGSELMAFYHRQVAEAVLERIGQGSEKRDRHLALADYFAGQPLWLDDDHTVPNARKTSELPYQQAHAGLGKELVATLTQFDFLRAKLEATNPQALIEDFGLYQALEANVAAESAQSLGLIHGALMLSAFALARGKDLLAGQLFGRLGGYSQPEIVQLLSSARHWTDRPWLRPVVSCLPRPGGALMRTLGTQSGFVGRIEITPDGRWAVSHGRSELKIWNLADGTCEHTYGQGRSLATALSSEPYKVLTYTWESDNVSGKHTVVLEILDLETGVCATRLRGSHKRIPQISSGAITPDGLRALSASYGYASKDDTIDVWDVASSRCIRTIAFGAEKVLISSSGLRGVSITPGYPKDQRGGLRIWNLESGRCIRVVKEYRGSPTPIITPDDRRLLFQTNQFGAVQVVDLNSGKDLCLLEGPKDKDNGYPFGIGGFAITPDGKQVVSGSNITRSRQGINVVQIWDLDTGACTRVLEGIGGILAIFPDSERALDRWLKIWDLRSGACLRELSPEHYEASLLSITPDAKHAVTFSERDNVMRLWDLENHGGPKSYEGHTEGILATALVPGSRHVVTSSQDKTLKTWDLRTGSHLSDLTGHGHWVRCAATTPDGRYLISGSDDHSIRVWDVHTGQCLHTLWSSKTMSIFALSVSPDGQQILAGAGNSLDLWDFSGEKPLPTFLGLHKDTVLWTAITPDGRLGISASITTSNREVMIWDLQKRCFLRALACQHLLYAAMLPDGRRLLTADSSTLNVWDLGTGECLRRINVNVGQGHYVGMMAVMPDARLAAVESRNALSVLDLETGNCVHMSSRKDGQSPTSGSVSADGKHLVAGHDDGLVEIWDLESGNKLAEFVGEGKFRSGGYEWGSAVISNDAIFYGDQTGRVYLLRLENVTPRAPVITAWREMPAAQEVAFGCPDCLTWSEVPASALGAELPCPQCGKPVKLNPFVIEADWRPVAAAWRGEKIPAAAPLEPAPGAIDEPAARVFADSADSPALTPAPAASIGLSPVAAQAPDTSAPARQGLWGGFGRKIKSALGKEHPDG